MWVSLLTCSIVVGVLFYAPPESTAFLFPSSTPRPSTRDSENRQLSSSQCIERYPDLYFEADRARAWYASRGGITEEAVDAAEQQGGNARLTILDNHVRAASQLQSGTDASSM